MLPKTNQKLYLLFILTNLILIYIGSHFLVFSAWIFLMYRSRICYTRKNFKLHHGLVTIIILQEPVMQLINVHSQKELVAKSSPGGFIKMVWLASWAAKKSACRLEFIQKLKSLLSVKCKLVEPIFCFYFTLKKDFCVKR